MVAKPHEFIDEGRFRSLRTDNSIQVSLKYRLFDTTGENRFATTVNDVGDYGYALRLSAGEGVDEPGADMKFVVEGDTINLNDINVSCKDGYEFAGWFYKDADGNIKKIDNLDNFKPSENMIIIAQAE